MLNMISSTRLKFCCVITHPWQTMLAMKVTLNQHAPSFPFCKQRSAINHGGNVQIKTLNLKHGGRLVINISSLSFYDWSHRPTTLMTSSLISKFLLLWPNTSVNTRLKRLHCKCISCFTEIIYFTRDVYILPSGKWPTFIIFEYYIYHEVSQNVNLYSYPFYPCIMVNEFINGVTETMSPVQCIMMLNHRPFCKRHIKMS